MSAVAVFHEQDEIFENTITHEEQAIEENEIINEKKIEEEPSDEYIETIGAYKESSKTNYLLITLSSCCILLITGLFVREKLKNN